MNPGEETATRAAKDLRMLSRSRRLLQDLKIPPRNAAVAAALVVVLALGSLTTLPPRATSAPEPTRTLAHTPPIAALQPPARRRFASRESVGVSRTVPEGTGGWWFGTAGVALALAVVGWGSVAARRFVVPRGGSGPVPMRVVGRTSLSPKHTVYLLDVGGRVLILGTGPQGAPTLLGELADPADVVPGGES